MINLFDKVLAVFGVVLYFAPTLIAYRWEAKDADSIFLVNAVFGWTIIGWLFVVFWAYSACKKDETVSLRTLLKLLDPRSGHLKTELQTAFKHTTESLRSQVLRFYRH